MMTTLRNTLFATVAGTALAGALPAGAMATTLPFTINPNAISGISGYSSQTVTDLQGTSDSLITQTSATTQSESGWIEFNSLVNGGTPLSTALTGETVAPGGSNQYTLYATFSTTVSGISGTGAGQSGTIAPGAFSFVLYADPTAADQFNAGSTSGTAPSVTDNSTYSGGVYGGSANDIVLAYGSSISGSAGFAGVNDAPFLSVQTSFNVCDGTVVGPCGSFDATQYFTAPVPFYSFALTSTITSSANNLTASPPYATLNGVVTDTSFQVPEPNSLALLSTFLFGLVGLGFVRQRTSLRG